MPAAARRRRASLALLVLLALLLLTVDALQGPEGPLSRLQVWAGGAFAPVVEGVDAALAPARSAVQRLGRLPGLAEEHAAVVAERDALQAREALLADLERENAALRDALGLRRRVEPATVTARVIGRPPGAAWVVLLDAGSAEGVAPDMAVLAPEGLVGKVTSVTASQARVELAVSPDAGYAVRVTDTGQQGLVSGRGEHGLELAVLDDAERTVPAGSEVRTRAFAGSAIPDGLPVGVVEAVRTVAGAPVHAVRPHADPDRLDVVLVVVGEPPASP